MVLFNEQFLASYLRQRFSLPDSVIYYILKNPSSSKVYQKLIQACKHFFIKNPILVIHCLYIFENVWGICANQGNCSPESCYIESNINSSTCKIWIQNQIQILSTVSNIAINLFSNIYQCDAKLVSFRNQKMSLHQFLFFARNVESLDLRKVTIISDQCAEIPIEEIIANLPNIIELSYEFALESKTVSSDTVRKLLQIPNFQQINILRLKNVSHQFDIDSIYDYYKKNKSRFSLFVEYSPTELPAPYFSKLERISVEIVDAVITEGFNNIVLYYDGQNSFFRFIMETI